MSYFNDIEAKIQYPVDPRRAEIGIGMVGTGRIVDEKHCPAYRKAGLRMVAATDLRQEQAEKIAAKHEIPKVYADLDSLLADPEVQVIDCAIPNDGRLDIIEAAAEAGKHILVHKPFAYTYEEGKSFVAAAEKHGIQLAVNQNARWAPTYGAATELLTSGAIGEPYWIHHQLLSGFDWFNNNSWHREMDRFQMHQYGIHHFDILAVWLGRQPESVFANMTRRPEQRYRGDMMTSVSCHYDAELQANLQETNALHPLRPWATHFEIHGTQGCIVSENLDRISIYNDETGADGEHHVFNISWFPDAFAYPMAELIQAIQEGSTPAHHAASTLPTLATVDAAYASAEQGLPVKPSL